MLFYWGRPSPWIKYAASYDVHGEVKGEGWPLNLPDECINLATNGVAVVTVCIRRHGFLSQTAN